MALEKGALKIGDLAAQGVSRRIYGSVDAEADLEGIAADARYDGMVALVLATGAVWYFDKDSSAGAVSGSVRVPTAGSGRWLVTVPSALALPDGSVDLGALATVSAAGEGPLIVIRKAFTAAGPGAADDVTVYASAVPYAMRFVDVWCDVATAISAKTAQLRTATAGGGSALSDAFDCATTGVKRNTAVTASSTVAAGSSIYLRRSDNGLAGEVFILAMKT